MRVSSKILVVYCGVDSLSFKGPGCEARVDFYPDHVLHDPSCYDLTPWATKYGHYLGEDTLGFIERIKQLAGYMKLTPVFVCSRDFLGQFAQSQTDTVFVCAEEGEENTRIIVVQSIPMELLLEIGVVLGLVSGKGEAEYISFASHYDAMVEDLRDKLKIQMKKNKEEQAIEGKITRRQLLRTRARLS